MQRADRATCSASSPKARPTRGPGCDHGAWRASAFRCAATSAARARRRQALPADYPFVRVEGDGVHEIAVGPVHAGIIEPGHFRFSVVGEKVLRLEERLGYTHKGIEQRFTRAGRRWRRIGSPAASRATRPSPSPGPTAWRSNRPRAARAAARARWLRALMLERERVANHLGDLGALGNDAALRVRPGAVLAPARGLAARFDATPSATA